MTVVRTKPTASTGSLAAKAKAQALANAKNQKGNVNTPAKEERKAYKGVVIGEPSDVFRKSNGSRYVLLNIELEILNKRTGQPLVINGQRTILNKKAIEALLEEGHTDDPNMRNAEFNVAAEEMTKTIPGIGEEVTVYASVVEDPIKGKKAFFDISVGGDIADSDEDILESI